MTLVKLLSSGVNFLPEGVLRVTGGGGSGFTGIILVDQNGALTGTSILKHGTDFTSDPDAVLIYYNSTNEEMVSYAGNAQGVISEWRRSVVMIIFVALRPS